MRLKKLKLSGFKSFAKSTTIEFPHAISAIVGPNGSGKSNVAEAIAWVLGEQSIKALRGKKGEDLIFNGSLSAPRMGKASAVLFFSHDEGEEASITRTVYRDGMNEYFINNRKSRLKDVIEQLSRIGLGASRHHIIGQGEADRALNLSFVERREMIEDALGLRIYQLKKEEGRRKLFKTEQNIRQVELLRREIQPHLRFLKKQVSKAEETLALRGKLKDLYSSYFSKIESRLKRDVENIELRKKDPRLEILGIEQKIKDLKERLLKFEKEKTKILEVRNKANNLEREIGRYEGMISASSQVAQLKEEKDKKKTVEIKIFEDLKDFVERGLEKAIKETDILKIKSLLSDLKEKIAVFLSDFKGGESVSNCQKSEDFKDLKQKRQDLLDSLLKVREEESRLLNENEESVELGRELYSKEIKLNNFYNKLRSLDLEKAQVDLRKRDFEREKEEAREILREEVLIGLAGDFTGEEIEKERREIERVKIRIEESGGIGEEIIKEYEEIKSRDDFLEKEIEDLNKTADSLNALIGQLEEKLAVDFKDGLNKINAEFQKFFELMFGGGKAELKAQTPKTKLQVLNDNEINITEGEDERQIEEGIEITVNLPRKKIRGLDMLSGGERTLASIALLFAMSQVNPPPFLVLDETDAALDESNSRKYAKMLKDLSRQTQLVLITHNRETMKCAGILYGVTMGSDSISRLLSVKLDQAEEIAAS